MSLTKEEVEKIAILARLGLSEEEKGVFAKQISSVLDYVEKLNEVNTNGVLPTAQVTGLENVLREDEVDASDKDVRDKLIEQAPEKDDDLIKAKAAL